MPFACSIKSIRTPHTKIHCSCNKIKNIKLDLLFTDSVRKAGKEENKERVSSFTTQESRGSLTIETALVLPLFLFAMLLILSLSDALSLYMKIQGAMHHNVRLAAQLAYDRPTDINGIYSRMLEDIGIGYLDGAPIAGGSSGLDITDSCVEGDVIDLVVQYKLQLPFDYAGIGTVTMRQRSLAHKWVGYGGGFRSDRTTRGEEYVYITPYGSVYHRSANCSHIRLSIRELTAEAVADCRNSDGGRYKACELCDGTLNCNHIYITEDGDRYHSSLRCSGLKRNIIAVPLAEAGGRRACSRCGIAGH